MIFWEVSCILLLVLILADRRETLKDLGFSLQIRDLLHSIGLFFSSFILQLIILFIYFFSHFLLSHNFNAVPDISAVNTQMDSFSKTPFFVLLLLCIINPFFEESIVRAFFITEVNLFFGKVGLSVFFSALIQAGYHLYQGWFFSIMHFIAFLLFSIYYQKTRRATALVLCHFYMDAIPMLGGSFLITYVHKYLEVVKH